jgi:hypothetical protein
MNAVRKLLRIWLTVASFIGFIAGWIFLSHTTTTTSVTYVGNTAVQMPALQAIPTVEGINGNSALNNVQTFTVNTNTSAFQSFFSSPLRTGGS